MTGAGDECLYHCSGAADIPIPIDDGLYQCSGAPDSPMPMPMPIPGGGTSGIGGIGG